jgi:hypothetical protein
VVKMWHLSDYIGKYVKDGK